MRTGKKTITGLCRRGRTFYWTTVNPAMSGATPAPAVARTLEIEEAVLANARALGAELRRQCPELTGAVSVALPADSMLLRVMELPVGDAEEMDGMIRLQMDKCSPFPDDRMAVSYEVLHGDADRRLVLMAGAHKDTVEFIGAMCNAAGLDLRRLDAEAAVWWQLIRDRAGAPDAPGRRIFSVIEQDQILLITVQDGRPLAFNILNLPADLPPDEYVEEFAREIRGLNLALDIEQAPATLSEIRFWTAGTDPGGWSEALSRDLQCPITCAPRDSLPALSAGTARRMLTPAFQPKTTPQGAQAVMDFTPVAWRTAEAVRRLQRQLALATVVSLGIWALGTGLFFAGYRLEHARSKQLDERLRTLKAPSEEVRTLQRKVRSFEQSLARDHWALETLREVSRLLPPGANISSFQFKRGRSVILRGEAETVNPIYDFKQALDASTMFRGVEMGSVQPGKRRNVTVQTFQMTAQLPEERP